MKENNGWKSRERSLDHRKPDSSTEAGLFDSGVYRVKEVAFIRIRCSLEHRSLFLEMTAGDEAQGLDIVNGQISSHASLSANLPVVAINGSKYLPYWVFQWFFTFLMTVLMLSEQDPRPGLCYILKYSEMYVEIDKKGREEGCERGIFAGSIKRETDTLI
ncbi:hypothetical protein OPV22_001752 [Ensete ventricosum]|uniref:Uncharacterized protein n=1 Tax=Ensete ventricosum TaxID=4639 RepID=A0AAV8RWF5_ENSVE|nr:hypothetical protein OPV22_001752 [Ensete ventricosum]